MAPTLHIVDPGFFRASGHHLAVDEALVRAAQRRGMRVRVLVQRDLPELDWHDATVLPAFSVAAPYEEQGGGPADTRLAETLRSELDAWLTPALAPGDCVVDHTLRGPCWEALLGWAGAGAATEVALRLLFRAPLTRDADPQAQARAAQRARAAWQQASALPELELFADTPALAADMAALSDRQVAELAPPVDFSQAPAEPPPAPAEEPVIAHFGRMRAEKGRAQILAALPALIARRPECRLFLHAAGQRFGEAIPEFLRTRLTLELDRLTPAALYARIQASTLVLVPYDPQAYDRRTSHIFLEALGLGRPVVTTPGTWMAAYMAQFDPQPGAIMADTSTDALIAACTAVLDDLPAKLAAAERAAPAIRARHDAAAVADRLVAPAGEGLACGC